MATFTLRRGLKPKAIPAIVEQAKTPRVYKYGDIAMLCDLEIGTTFKVKFREDQQWSDLTYEKLDEGEIASVYAGVTAMYSVDLDIRCLVMDGPGRGPARR